MLYELNENRKSRRFQVSKAFYICIQDDSLLQHFLMCDKNWNEHDDKRRCARLLDRYENLRHFLKPKFHQKKATLTIHFVCTAAVIYHSFLNLVQATIAEKYSSKSKNSTRNFNGRAVVYK